jgi:hypothetical protein
VLRLAAPLAALCAIVALAVVFALAPDPGVGGHVSYAYHWPIKPFDRQHPIRGAFGDPRTYVKDQPFGVTGPDDGGSYFFHGGVDIVGQPGTPVYPVVDGVVTLFTPHHIHVDSTYTREFDYWHLRWNVHLGEQVYAEKTVIGWIQAPFDHVHLGEVDGVHGRNPLGAGHLEPYADHTKPRILALDLENGGAPDLTQGGVLLPKTTIAIDAIDPPAMPVTGSFAGLPQTPALVQWRLRTGREWGAWHLVVDFRKTQPRPLDYWNVYAPGTYQNAPVFGTHLYAGTAGRYLFRVGLDPKQLAPGRYELEARVADVRGNSGAKTWPVEVRAR